MPRGDPANLAWAMGELEAHRAAHRECADRWAASGAVGGTLAAELLLSHATGTQPFELICGGWSLMSRRSLNGGNPPVDADGAHPVEVGLGTDDDVFAYAGPFRYPNAPCGLLFGPDLERAHPGPTAAAPFDTGGVASGYLTSGDSGLTATEFVRRWSLPVPAYRAYLAQLVASAFADPLAYLDDGSAPLCDVPIPVTGGDARRWTFELRFAGRVSLDWGLRAVLVPAPVVQEPWFDAPLARCEAARVRVEPYSTEDGTDWQVMRDLSVRLIRAAAGV